jgi:hypothetical protein
MFRRFELGCSDIQSGAECTRESVEPRGYRDIFLRPLRTNGSPPETDPIGCERGQKKIENKITKPRHVCAKL